MQVFKLYYEYKTKAKPILAHKWIDSFPSNIVVTEPRFLKAAVLTELLTVAATVATQLTMVTAKYDAEWCNNTGRFLVVAHGRFGGRGNAACITTRNLETRSCQEQGRARATACQQHLARWRQTASSLSSRCWTAPPVRRCVESWHTRTCPSRCCCRCFRFLDKIYSQFILL